MAHLTCWIGLDDSLIDNGCVHYVPGSHRWDLLQITGLAGDMDAIRQVLSDSQWEQFRRPVAVELKKGECTFHHPLMVHGSFANRTERPRRATVINAVLDGVRSATDESLLRGVPSLGEGIPLSGRFFPLLYTPGHCSVLRPPPDTVWLAVRRLGRRAECRSSVAQGTIPAPNPLIYGYRKSTHRKPAGIAMRVSIPSRDTTPILRGHHQPETPFLALRLLLLVLVLAPVLVLLWSSNGRPSTTCQ
jgi:hypothetical protein